MAGTHGKQPDHWLALGPPGSGGSWGCRIESVGVKLPAQRLTTRDLMSTTSHRTRIQIESGLLNSGVIRLGAIVTSDVDPGHHHPGAVLLQPAAGAILLGRDEELAGFTDFYTETFPEYDDLFASGLVWQERHGHRVPRQATGQHEMVIECKPSYAARLADCAEEASRRFLRSLDMSWGEIDLVVPAPSSPDFLDALMTRLGVPGDRVAYITEDLEGAYTTGPIAALQAAIRSGRLGEARNTLMLAAGAGVTVALALYRQTPR